MAKKSFFSLGGEREDKERGGGEGVGGGGEGIGKGKGGGEEGEGEEEGGVRGGGEERKLERGNVEAEFARLINELGAVVVKGRGMYVNVCMCCVCCMRFVFSVY